MNDIHDVSDMEAITYAASKLDAAAALSASYHPDAYKPHEGPDRQREKCSPTASTLMIHEPLFP